MIHARVGGQGPAVILIHGFGDTGDMWAPLAADMMSDHTVIALDLRGMGLSSSAERGYDKKTQGQDIASVLDALKVEKADLVTHDIGNMVGYAFAAQYPDRVKRWVVMDAPLPPELATGTKLFAARCFGISTFGDLMSRDWLRAARRIYLDRFYNELSADPKAIDEATRAHYAALYARPHAMHNAFEQFAAFSQDAVDNKAFLGQGQAVDASVGNRCRSFIRCRHGYRTRLCRFQRQRKSHRKLRSLDDGRAARGDSRRHYRLSKIGLGPAATKRKPLPGYLLFSIAGCGPIDAVMSIKPSTRVALIQHSANIAEEYHHESSIGKSCYRNRGERRNRLGDSRAVRR